MVEDSVQPCTWRKYLRSLANSRVSAAHVQWMAQTYWADIFGNWTLRSIPTLDGTGLDALLYLLPGLVRLLLIPLYGQVEFVRLDHVLEQCRCQHASAGALAALCAYLPGRI